MISPGRRSLPAGTSSRRALGLAAVAALVVAVGLVGPWWARPAGAHSFLVATSPAQGERLASAPQAVVLAFSEPVDPSTVRVDVRTAGGGRAPAGPVQLTAGGLEVRVDAAELSDAIYVVAWEALSTVDGHGTSGEFAFAVGDAGGAIPAPTQSSPTSGSGVATSWVFFAGVALATGALVLQAAAPALDPPGPTVVWAGVLVAMAGAAIALVQADRRELLLLLCLQALAVALVAVRVARGWLPPAVGIAAAAALWSGRSHGAASHGALGWSIDAVHLLAGAAWVGSLVLAVWAGWRLRHRQQPWLPLVRAYARVAVVFVVVLGVAGIAAGVELLPSWRSLWDTGYGRLVSLKAILFATAVVLAGAGRWWGLRTRRRDGLRRSMTAEGAVLVGALVVAALLVNGAPPQPAGAVEQLLGPPPLQGPLSRDAGLAGQLNVEVTTDGDRLDIKVFGPSGPLRGTDVDIATQAPDSSEADLVPRPCGPGCFTQPLELQDGVTTVSVAATAPVWTGGTYRAQLTWPPGPPAVDVLGQVVNRMRQIPELTLTETVTSGPRATAGPSTYTISGDRFIDLEPYAAVNLDDVQLLPGRPPRLVLYLPGSQIYGLLELDEESRIASARLVTPGHEMTRTFDYPKHEPAPQSGP